MRTKRCRICTLMLGLNSFTKNKSAADGLASYCRQCAKVYRQDLRNKKAGQSDLAMVENEEGYFVVSFD